MPDEKETDSAQSVNEELRKEEPGLTIAPPQLKLNQEPIPNPDLNVDNGKK